MHHSEEKAVLILEQPSKHNYDNNIISNPPQEDPFPPFLPASFQHSHLQDTWRLKRDFQNVSLVRWTMKPIFCIRKRQSELECELNGIWRLRLLRVAMATIWRNWKWSCKVSFSVPLLISFFCNPFTCMSSQRGSFKRVVTAVSAQSSVFSSSILHPSTFAWDTKTDKPHSRPQLGYIQAAHVSRTQWMRLITKNNSWLPLLEEHWTGKGR